MKVVVVGIGVQGKKRIKSIGKNLVATVDPNNSADYNSIQEVPLSIYDTAIVCVPDLLKYNVLKYLIKNKKNIMVEKPLFYKNKNLLIKLSKLLKKNQTILYTAYNHRFEPNIARVKEILKKKKIGKIYMCRLFYGNGTSMLVKKSLWKDKNSGVIQDLLSHLIDIIYFWFGSKKLALKLIKKNSFENKSPDHVLVNGKHNSIFLELEASYCMWKNHFTCDIIGQRGSIHISSLSKWDKTKLIIRKRKFPSGYPSEKIISEKIKDPTWNQEFQYFKKLIKNNIKTDLSKDIMINNHLNNIIRSN